MAKAEAKVAKVKAKAEAKVAEAEAAAVAAQARAASVRARLDERRKRHLKACVAQNDVSTKLISQNTADLSIPLDKVAPPEPVPEPTREEKFLVIAKAMAEAVSTAAATATATAEAVALAEANKTRLTSALAAIKLVERLRPDNKFDGRSKNVDFLDHIGQFLRAVDIPDLPTAKKLSELQHWFEGAALNCIKKYFFMKDAEKAFLEAIAMLQNEYKNSAPSAEEMLSGVLDGEPLERSDFPGVEMCIATIENIHFLAIDTDRDESFNHPLLYKRILTEKLPFFIHEWSEFLVEQKQEGKAIPFQVFLNFLDQQSRIRRYNWKMGVDFLEMSPTESASLVSLPLPSPAPSELASLVSLSSSSLVPTKVVRRQKRRHRTTSSTASSTASSMASSRMAEMPKMEPAPSPVPLCCICKKGHWLEFCPQFLELQIDEKIDYLNYTTRCGRCIRPHQTSDCRVNVKCDFCHGRHHTLLHDAFHSRLCT